MFIHLVLVTICSSQVWWVKSVLWTSWYLKQLNVERKLLPTPNWSLLWLKRLLTQVSKAYFYIIIKLKCVSMGCYSFFCAIAAYELTLAEGSRLEKRLFHATFATVSGGVHLKASEEVCESNVGAHLTLVFVFFPCRMTAKKAWLHLWRRERPVSKTSSKIAKVKKKFLISTDPVPDKLFKLGFGTQVSYHRGTSHAEA